MRECIVLFFLLSSIRIQAQEIELGLYNHTANIAYKQRFGSVGVSCFVGILPKLKVGIGSEFLKCNYSYVVPTLYPEPKSPYKDIFTIWNIDLLAKYNFLRKNSKYKVVGFAGLTFQNFNVNFVSYEHVLFQKLNKVERTNLNVQIVVPKFGISQQFLISNRLELFGSLYLRPRQGVINYQRKIYIENSAYPRLIYEDFHQNLQAGWDIGLIYNFSAKK